MNETVFLFHKFYKISIYNAAFRRNQALPKATNRNLQPCKDRDLAEPFTCNLGHASSGSSFFSVWAGTWTWVSCISAECLNASM